MNHIVNMLTVRFVFIAMMSSFVMTGASSVVAQEAAEQKQPKPKPTAVTLVEEADEDFAFQGEYKGMILDADADPESQRKIGLQVVALGDGQFSAAYFDKGLPGWGADSASRKEMTGVRAEDSLLLTNDELSAEIMNGMAVLRTYEGKDLGTIPRVMRESPTLGMKPPRGAVVLFDGSHTDHFQNGKISEDGYLQEGADILTRFRDFKLHLEFKLPYMPHARGQARSNSGVYLQSRYEIQILDSFGLPGEFNECGALYRYRKPWFNMCLPPLQWQTYDITFRSARFDTRGNKIQDAYIDVVQNGASVQPQVNPQRKTGAGKPEGPELLVTKLQNHGNPVRFRNIWIKDLSPPVYGIPVDSATWRSLADSQN